jgi:dipeptidase D
MQELYSLKSGLVWQYFNQLRQIPRASGNESAVIDWLKQFANQNQFDYKTDSVNNICIHVPATPEHKSSKTVILQNHADMVTEKRPEIQFDFATDPIQVQIIDGWLQAVGTTLGADNGIGLCLALAMATDPKISHPNLQILVTIEEETTFKGATSLDPIALQLNGDYLLNLDTEEIGEICVSSAGMLRTSAGFRLQRKPASTTEKSYVQVSLKNLPGGHSGCQIHEIHRENAILAVLQLIKSLPNATLVSIDGGDKDNAIPRDCTAVIEVEPETAFGLISTKPVTNQGYSFELEILPHDKVQFASFTLEFNELFLNTLTSLPNGALKLSSEILDLVQTSSNFASIKTNQDTAELKISIRSSHTPEIQSTFADCNNLLNLLDATVEKQRLTPGWVAQSDSYLVQLAATAYLQVTGQSAKIKAIHAGLEVGEITNRIKSATQKDVQALSFGPTIVDPHTPQERVKIKDVDTIYIHLSELLKLID